MILDDDGIKARSSFGRTKRIRWEDIVYVDFYTGRSSPLFIVRNKTGVEIVMRALLTGLKEFTLVLEKRTPPEVHESACLGYPAFRWFSF